MVKLPPEQQHYLSKDYLEAFVPVKGVWGRRRATSICLKAAEKGILCKAIEAAWRNTAPQRLVTKLDQKELEPWPGTRPAIDITLAIIGRSVFV
jgi:hypothetical protein